MKNLLYFAGAASLATALITLPLGGCSSSSSVGSGDSGSDSPTTHGDTGPHADAKGDGKMTGNDSGKDGQVGMDTGTDGPCNFATFVLGLIANDTTASAKPSTNLGQSCTDDQKQSDFASLF
jgi:hypothetical protein